MERRSGLTHTPHVRSIMYPKFMATFWQSEACLKNLEHLVHKPISDGDFVLFIVRLKWLKSWGFYENIGNPLNWPPRPFQTTYLCCILTTWPSSGFPNGVTLAPKRSTAARKKGTMLAKNQAKKSVNVTMQLGSAGSWCSFLDPAPPKKKKNMEMQGNPCPPP